MCFSWLYIIPKRALWAQFIANIVHLMVYLLKMYDHAQVLLSLKSICFLSVNFYVSVHFFQIYLFSSKFLFLLSSVYYVTWKKTTSEQTECDWQCLSFLKMKNNVCVYVCEMWLNVLPQLALMCVNKVHLGLYNLFIYFYACVSAAGWINLQQICCADCVYYS